MDIRCNDVLQIFETIFFDHWVKRIYKGYYYSHMDL